MKGIVKQILTAILLVAVLCGSASAIRPGDLEAVNSTSNTAPAVLASKMIPFATTSNAKFTGSNSAAGTFRNGLDDGIGIDRGFIFTTGAIVNAIEPNPDGAITAAHGLPGDEDLDALVAPVPTFDASVFEFDFVIRDARRTSLVFQLVFASDEYNESIDDPAGVGNDVFALFIDGMNIALVPGTGDPVTIKTLNRIVTPGLYTDNDPEELGVPTPFATQYDGFSKVLTATVTVTPGVAHHFKLAVADASDDTSDSAVFIAPAVFQSGESLGVFRQGRWSLDNSGDGSFNRSSGDTTFAFGLPTDIPIRGDWNGDGKSEVGVFRSGRFILDMNGNDLFDPGVDRVFMFGLPTDVPVVGNWDGIGGDEVGVFRAGRFILDMNGNGAFDPGVDRAFTFGIPTDIPVVGNWDGIGGDEVGVFRAGRFILDVNGNGVFDPGVDRVFTFGLPTDRPIAGNWDGGTGDEVGVFRSGQFILDLTGNGGFDTGTDQGFTFGLPTDRPVTGLW